MASEQKQRKRDHDVKHAALWRLKPFHTTPLKKKKKVVKTQCVFDAIPMFWNSGCLTARMNL